MKGRGHRLQSADLHHHDDWVDGSWTVDCVCGVNFDDGEEMVNCDECGVWVHTRCSRYVKGQDLFTCDKCKGKSNRNDSVETEVAQLLVELPTKTVRMESAYSANVPARQSFRLWTDIPMEHRVHVQGIPGGDPSLFKGLSSVFTPELWKCTGYVPKKFNFQYKEFPCWEEKEPDVKNEQENENLIDKGAGVLFSLSKESLLAAPVASMVGMRGKNKEDASERKESAKDMKKESTLLGPSVMQSCKRKKEDLWAWKDQSGKKKARNAHKEADGKNGSGHASKTATSEAKQVEFHEDRGPKYIKTNGQCNKDKRLRDTVTQEPVSDNHLAVDNGAKEPKTKLTAIESSSEGLSSDISVRNASIEAVKEEDNAMVHQSSALIDNPSRNADSAPSLLKTNDVGHISVKQEGDGIMIGNVDGTVVGPDGSTVKPCVEDVAIAAQEWNCKQVYQIPNGDMSTSSFEPHIIVKEDFDDMENTGLSCDHTSETSKENIVGATGPKSNDPKVIDTDRTSEAFNDSLTDKADEFAGDPCRLTQELENSEGSMALQNCPSDPKQVSVYAEEVSKSVGTLSTSPALPSQHKVVVCVGKPSSASSIAVISRTSTSENSRPADTHNCNPISKQRVSDCNIGSKKNCSASDIGDEVRRDISRKSEKERSRSSLSCSSKASHSSKISHVPVPKQIETKDNFVHLSKTSLPQSIALTSVSGETGGSPQVQCASHEQNKISTSGSSQRGDRYNHSNPQPSSKMNHVPPMHPSVPSNSNAGLSDEELALRLHQELNSSPRVPRPRVRHAGSLPQLSSPTATSMLIKRTSSSGGKDHSSVSRRKYKDTSKDGFRRSHELEHDARKADRGPSSPDQRKDMGYAAESSSKREDIGSQARLHSVKKNFPSSSGATANSGPSSFAGANDHHASSMHNSPRNFSDEDTGTIRDPVHRTLPGLINEIMSKGRRMTYDELCNAVLPHWHNLRKHNGERYAYSTPSQAVLDCLRNRQEWAQLVDRGPKTNPSRRRRKFDAEYSEDNEYGKGRSVNELDSRGFESQRDEFPKGKRKARKRRRLALQGRGVKDLRKRQKVDMPSDDDIGSFSNSSEESNFSEDEIEGGARKVGTEASASSDEGTT
ncbi:uncharacterized protein LOC119986742 isoform X2 [Tripterygium wilfordii]|uniref:uncharacterized protein LOC119986742 isoform X2 n=1 Tax=Tripterygium wilfordii TaxID=458696 RepID=UPI0018F85D86|nr:uncharacterized protein LOC119986742 isoform X2 [Tripterygium wilfordii]